MPLPVICPNGHQNPANQHFCGECGAPLEEAHQTRQVPDDESQQADVSEATEERQPSAEVHHHRNRVDGGSRGDDLSGPLNEGDRVQVVERDDEFNGKVGVVDEPEDGSDERTAPDLGPLAPARTPPPNASLALMTLEDAVAAQRALPRGRS